MSGTVLDYLAVELTKPIPSPLPSVYWVKSKGSYLYKDVAGSVVIAEQQMSKIGKTVVDLHRGGMRTINQQFTAGQISLDQWQTRIATELKHGHLNAHMIARGGYNNMGYRDWGIVGAKLKKEYGYLNGFAQEIEAGLLSERQIAARLDQYASGISTSYERGREEAKRDAGYTHSQRFLGAAEHCEDCLVYARQGVQPIGVLPLPGENSACMHQCKCDIRYFNPEDLARMEAEKEAKRDIRERQKGKPRLSGRSEAISDTEYERVRNLYEADENIHGDIRAKMKDDIAQFLSDETGLDYERCNKVVRQWATTSNDESWAALELQRIAAEKYGTVMSDWQIEKWKRLKTMRAEASARQTIPRKLLTPFENFHGKLVPERLAGYATQEEAYGAILDAMYKHTQTYLRETYGGNSIRMWRGVDLTEKQFSALRQLGIDAGGVVDLEANALESWAVDRVAAESFSGYGTGAVFEAEVPFSRIISSARTGFGCLDEYEFLVLGNFEGDTAMLYRLARETAY